ncbi:hypothetical protein N3K66_007155 [Trichothecium roseum]|uniref:Uncharacterized protein n=1 Tax=Trichothecium roseum TaxID=47278 RepID=A0ACC0UZ24_9HYPO|nr:hypothetical protein N3K66_007155 [Trichothecium roseum]
MELRREVALRHNLDVESIEDIYPCTPFQAGVLSLSGTKFNAYTMNAVMSLSPGTDLQRFQRAWDETVRTTPILRTRFVEHAELGFLQVVLSGSPRWVEVEDMETYAKSHDDAAVKFERVLCRFGLWQDGQEASFVWTIHHALFDGWSLGQITSKASRCFRHLEADEGTDFGEFVRRLSMLPAEEGEEYWKETLHQAPTVDFPQNLFTGTSPETFHRMSKSFPSLPPLTGNVRRSDLVHAAWATVIAFHTASQDVVFGSISAGRRGNQAAKEAIGPTISTVPIRVRVRPSQTARDFLTTVQEESSQRWEHEYMGLSNIANIDASTLSACQFQTLLVVQPTLNDLAFDEEVGKWQTSSKDMINTTYPLTLSIFLGEDETIINADYDGSILDDWILANMLQQFDIAIRHLASQDLEAKTTRMDSVLLPSLREIWEWNRQVPVPLEKLVDSDVPSLKSLLLVGEPMSIADAERWHGAVKLINGFGPAETSPLTVINNKATDALASTRIGKGVGVVTWVVDPVDHGRLSPMGSIGELLLEGPLLGDGYLNDEEKTKQAFVNDPEWLLHGSSRQPGRQGRLYKTGDLVRYNNDGSLSYIGRKDTQVKIRGQRVELGEVERHAGELLASDADQVVAEVVTPHGQDASSHLAVFMASTSKPKDGSMRIFTVSNEFEDAMAQRLPPYMLPSLYFSMPQLPVSSNGKTDRKQLRQLVALREGISWAHAAELPKYLDADRQEAMTLGRPLARYALVGEKPEEPQWFVWTLHHALYDGSSIQLMLNLVEDIYVGARLDTSPPSDPRHFIQYQQEKDNDEAKSFWKSQLAQNESVAFPGLPPTVLEPVPDSTMENDHALTLECTPQADGVHIHAIFDSKVMPGEEMQRVIDQFGCILERILQAGDEEKIGSLDTLTADDYDTIWEWNGKVPSAVDQCVHELATQKHGSPRLSNR